MKATALNKLANCLTVLALLLASGCAKERSSMQEMNGQETGTTMDTMKSDDGMMMEKEKKMDVEREKMMK